MTMTLGTGVRNAMADAAVDSLDLGSGAATIQIRTGAKPATPQTAATGTLLATVTLSDPAAGAAAAGAAVIANPAAVVAVGTGTAGWARFLDSSAVACWDCDVTATGGGGDITLATTAVSTGLSVDLDAITFTQPQ